MKFNQILAFIVFLCCSTLFTVEMKGQNRFTQNGIDSTAIANRVQKEYDRRDSIQNALRLKRSQDSLAREMAKIKMQEYRDSLTNARNKKRTEDSLARIAAKEKLLNDKRIKDSTDSALRQKMIDDMEATRAKAEMQREEQKRISDSIASERKRYTDSVILARRNFTDSMKQVRAEQAAARKALAEYKKSKDYKDSIATAKADKSELLKEQRQRYNDSIRTARESINDSIKNVRQRTNDSIASVRKTTNDIAKAERQRLTDSMTAFRKKLRDSIDARKEKLTKTSKDSVEKKKKDLALKVNMAEKIHEKKQEEYSSDKFLKKKWSLRRRIYQNTVTRYNYYYNAKRKYDDAVQRLNKNNKDDYSKNIHLFSFDVEKAGTSVASDMDSVIKKSSFSTQIHDPRSKWFDNLFFMMGKASFIKNDFDGAIQTLQFVANEYKDDKSKNKKGSTARTKKTTDTTVNIATIDNRKGIKKFRHHPIRNEALVLLAKSHIMAEQYSEASALLSDLEKDKNFPKRNKTDLYLTKAYLELTMNNPKDAIASLENGLKQKSKGISQTRMQYVLAQLYADQKDYKNSTQHFKKALSRKNSDEMNFFTKLNIAQNAALSGEDKRLAKNQLDKIINNPKFSKYKSQALNVLAKIVEDEMPEKAIEYLTNSINNKDNNDPTQKANAFASLGNIYYKLENYKPAKMAYDSAAQYGTNPPIDNIDLVNTRKTVLKDIVEYLSIIHEMDSLIDLSKKSEKDQKAIAKKALEDLKKNKDASDVKATTTTVTALQPNNKVKSSWYFYNNSLLQDGTNEFKLKWGTRKLEDNWRRSAATNSFANTQNGNASGDENGDKKENEVLNVDGQSVASLLSKLPKTPAEYDLANTKINEAYYKLGLAYFSQLENYPKSVQTFDTLLYRFPNFDNKKQVYYALYLNHQKLNNVALATKYKNLLQNEFSTSELSAIANNPNYEAEKKNALKVIMDHYDSTYTSYLRKDYNEAMASVDYANSKFNINPLKAKYDLIHAMSLVGKKEIEPAKIELEKIISSYQNTEEKTHAENILNYLKSNIQTPTDSVASILNPSAGTNNKTGDSIEASDAFKPLREAEGKAVYIYNQNDEHFVMIFIRAFDGRGIALKSGLSDYNLLKYNVEGYTTGLNLLTEKQGIVNVQKFSNAIFAKKYSNSMQNEKLLFSQLKKSEYEIMIISLANHAELLKTRDILGYIKFYKANYK